MARSRDGVSRRGTDAHGTPVWRINIQRTDPLTGRRERVYETFHGTYRQALRHRAELAAQMEDGTTSADGAMSFAAYSRSWLDARAASGRYSPDTIARDKTIVGILSERIGKAKMRDVNAAHVRSLLTALKEDRGVKNTTVKRYHVALHSIFKQAVHDGLIPYNPVDRVEAPAAEKPDRRSLTQDEAARLMRAVERDAQGSDAARVTAVRIALATGARRGEVLALTWAKVDLGRMAIRIDESLTKYGRRKQPKTESSTRTVAIDHGTASCLAAWMATQREQMEAVGISQTRDTPVVTSAAFGYTNPSNFSRWWRQWTRDNGFEGLRFHELRHTQATHLLANGVDVKTVQARLGHASAATTMDFYAHAIPEKDHAAADLIGGLFATSRP